MSHGLPRRSLIHLLTVLALAVGVVAAAPASRSVDVIVVLEDGYAAGSHEANKERAADVARDHGLSPSQTYGTALFGFAASVPEGRLNGLNNDPRVDYVDRDGAVHAFGETAPWGVARIGLDSTTRSGNVGAGVHVYVIDTGIDLDHPDLAANVVAGEGFAAETCKGGSCLAAWDDDHGHGTHVAGTIGAVDNDLDVIGVAPGVKLHAVKVLSKAGSGSRSGVIAGIDWVTDHASSRSGASVANMSLGGTGSKSGSCTETGFTGSDSYHNAICNSARGGTVYAVAAGNDGGDAQGKVPAAYDDAVITVSATGPSDEWPSWSNWGDGQPDRWSDVTSDPVTIAAPGRYVVSTKLGGGTTSMSGTSMAAPHVAGWVALYLEANPQNEALSAFLNARSELLAKSESTASFDRTASSNPHTERFVDAGHLLTTVADTTAPGAPTGLAATAGDARVTLDWTDNTETDLAGYDVYRRTAETSYAKISTALVTDSAYTDQGLTNGTTYYYQVTAVDTSGNRSAPSAQVSATPQPDSTAPLAPTGLVASAGDARVTLDWDDNTESDLAGYRVERSTTTGAGYTTLTDTPITDSTYTDTTAANGTSYYYVVRAVDTSGNPSDASNEASATPQPSSGPSVESIAYSRTGGKGNTLHLLITVRIVDGTSPVYNATVAADIWNDQNGAGSASGTTDTNGYVTFKWTNAPVACYSTDVTAINGVPETNGAYTECNV